MSDIHYHHCPSCYEKYQCDMNCTIEPDLEDTTCHPGKQFGAHCVCDKCEGNAGIFSTAWWNKYNGITK